jgi:hypothetical protein
MNHDPKASNPGNSDPSTEVSVSRRAIAKKIAYVAPAVLAVISIAERPALAASVIPPG